MSAFRMIIQAFKNLQRIHLSNNIITYFVCVVIASVAWILNALEKDYSTELAYPIKYIHLPEDQYLISELPSELQLGVQAKGFILLGHRLKTSFLPITINFNTYIPHLKNQNGISEYTLSSENIKDKIASQINPNIKLLNINPEYIEFKFAPSKQKKVAVRPAVNYTLKQQYILTRMYTVPDSISVSGPATIIDTLQYIPTSQIQLSKLDKPSHHTLELIPLSHLSLKETEVTLFWEVEQFTEVKRTFPITALHVPDSMNIRLFPQQVHVTYEIGLSKYDKVSDQDFIFSVEYPRNAKSEFLEVKISNAPTFIKNLSYTPRKVEYILEKK